MLPNADLTAHNSVRYHHMNTYIHTYNIDDSWIEIGYVPAQKFRTDVQRRTLAGPLYPPDNISLRSALRT